MAKRTKIPKGKVTIGRMLQLDAVDQLIEGIVRDRCEIRGVAVMVKMQNGYEVMRYTGMTDSELLGILEINYERVKERALGWDA